LGEPVNSVDANSVISFVRDRKLSRNLNNLFTLVTLAYSVKVIGQLDRPSFPPLHKSPDRVYIEQVCINRVYLQPQFRTEILVASMTKRMKVGLHLCFSDGSVAH